MWCVLSEEELSKQAHNLISNVLAEEEMSKKLYNLIYSHLPEKELGYDIYMEKLNEAKIMLKRVKEKFPGMSEKDLEKCSLEISLSVDWYKSMIW